LETPLRDNTQDYGRYIRKVYKDLLPKATISRSQSDVNDFEMEEMAHVHKGRKGNGHKGKEKNQPFRVSLSLVSMGRRITLPTWPTLTDLPH
jgi:hypothetical protein